MARDHQSRGRLLDMGATSEGRRSRKEEQPGGRSQRREARFAESLEGSFIEGPHRRALTQADPGLINRAVQQERGGGLCGVWPLQASEGSEHRCGGDSRPVNHLVDDAASRAHLIDSPHAPFLPLLPGRQQRRHCATRDIAQCEQRS